MESPRISHDIEALLMSFKGLKKLCLEKITHRLVSKEIIANHHLTLETLAIGRWTGRNPTYSMQYLRTILTSYPSLKELGLCIDKGRETLELEDTCYSNPVLTSDVQARLVSKVQTPTPQAWR
jgi:hypothetical protein